MSKLSAWNYIRNSKKTVGVLVIALALSLMAMYVVYVLLDITSASFKRPMTELPERIVMGELDSNVLQMEQREGESSEAYSERYEARREELIEALKQKEYVRDAFHTQIINAPYFAIFGQCYWGSPLVEPEKIPELLEHMDARLIEGRLPSGSGEILVDSIVMKNQNYHIGDWFCRKAFGETFRVVGVIESDYMFCCGTPQGYSNNGWRLVILTDKEHADYKALLEAEGCKVAEENLDADVPYGKKVYKEETVDVIHSVVSVVSLVVSIFLAISVLVAYVSFLRNRMNEYALYTSIGFSRAEVYGMIMREMGIIFGGGALLGAGLSLLGALLINKLLAVPMGLISRIWYPGEMMKYLVIYLMIMGVLQLPVLLSVNKIKTIDAIEEL